MPATNKKAKVRRPNMEFMLPPTEGFLTRYCRKRRKCSQSGLRMFACKSDPDTGGKEHLLRMVWWPAQVGVQKAPALGRGTAVRRFESHEYCVDVLQNARIVYFEDPAVKRGIVHIEE